MTKRAGLRILFAFVALSFFYSSVQAQDAADYKAKEKKARKIQQKSDDNVYTASVWKRWVIKDGKWWPASEGKNMKVPKGGATITSARSLTPKCVYQVKLVREETEWKGPADSRGTRKGTVKHHLYRTFKNVKEMVGANVSTAGEYLIEPVLFSPPARTGKNYDFECKNVNVELIYTVP